MANHHTRENPAPTAEEKTQLERWSRRLGLGKIHAISV